MDLQTNRDELLNACRTLMSLATDIIDLTTVKDGDYLSFNNELQTMYRLLQTPIRPADVTQCYEVAYLRTCATPMNIYDDEDGSLCDEGVVTLERKIVRTVLPMEIADEPFGAILQAIAREGMLKIPFEQLREYCPNVDELLPMDWIPGNDNAGQRPGTRQQRSRGLQIVDIRKL